MGDSGASRLDLERLAPRHLDRVGAWLSTPSINRWLTEEWRGATVGPAMLSTLMRSARNQVYVVVIDGIEVGIVALANIERQDGTAMVWYLLGDGGFAGRGLMTRAVAALVDMAFGESFSSLYAWVIDGNLPSAALLKRVGFREVGRIRNAARSDDRRVDRIYFDLLPGEVLRSEPRESA